MTTCTREQKYLDRYVLADSRKAASLIATKSNSRYRRTLCIPAYDERIDFIEALQRHSNIADTLIILVVNAPDNAPEDRLANTRKLLHQLTQTAQQLWQSEHCLMLELKCPGGTFSILVMDHCSEGRCLPYKQGVGAARKLGNDVALELWCAGKIDSAWLYQTDADATLPDNYFRTPDSLEDCVAVHLDFRHTANGETSLAQQLYDLKLDYYIAGLIYAESPYAHYSLGSALVINTNAYSVVRGYPKRSAGEDFYILNKLAKYGRIAFDPTRTITLRERHSTRVPFGTGPGVLRFQKLDSPLTSEEFYAPECFVALKTWLLFITHVAQSNAGDSTINTTSAFQQFDGSPSTTITCSALEKLGMFDWLELILKKYKTPKQTLHQVTTGMDALRTLQLIHALRDSGLKNVPARMAEQWLTPYQKTVNKSQIRLRRNVNGRITVV